MREDVVAHHEAAHAVIGILLGVPVQVVTIEKSGATLGYMRPALSVNEIDMDAVVITWLGGPAAERRLTGSAGPGCADDFKVARDFVAAMLPGEPTPQRVEEHLARFNAIAEARVTLNWKWIERTAKSLLRRRRLTGADVADLMT